MTSISDTNVVNAPGGLVELGYSQITAPVNITSTTFASPNNVISDITVVCDGSPIIVEIYSPYLQTSPQTQYSIIPILRYDGNLYKLGIFTADANLYAYSMQFMQVRLTPSAGVHTFGVAASTESAQTAVWGAGNGASGGAHTPSYIRISKVIQASQLIVQTPNAPLVTSLPSNAIDGQEVRYLADNTNGIIWNFRYRAGSSSSYKWEFIGGAPLYSAGSGGITTTSTSWVFWSTSPNITVPFAGDYLAEVAASCGQQTNAVNTAYCTIGVNGGSQSENNGVWSTSSGQWDGSTGMNVTKMTLAANDNLRFYVRGDYNTSTSAFDKGRLSVTPIRVSA